MRFKAVLARVGEKPTVVEIADTLVGLEGAVGGDPGGMIQHLWDILPKPYTVFCKDRSQGTPWTTPEGWLGVHGDIFITRSGRMSFVYESLTEAEAAAIIEFMYAWARLRRQLKR